MTDILPNSEQRTLEERSAVRERLVRDGYEWVTERPDYVTFSRSRTLRKLDNVLTAVLEETDADGDAVEIAYEQSRRFVQNSFDFYEGNTSLPQSIGRAFVVPMRSTRPEARDTSNEISRSDDGYEIYASESTPFMPLFDPYKFGVGSEVRMRAFYGLPPLILDTYSKSDNPLGRGAVILAPLYTDMERDIVTDPKNEAQVRQLLEDGRTILRATTEFTHRRLGAKVIGLGAILPKLTYFGQALHSPDMPKLVTTTGHGGTVHMIVETVRKIMHETSIESEKKIGVIGGAGSIGWSSTVSAMESFPDHKIVTFDKNSHQLIENVNSYDWNRRMNIVGNARMVLEETNVIMVATTTSIDLDEIDPNNTLDLRGKVIIDDSQPGCFDVKQVEARGGKLVWVVGEDGSESEFMTRDGYHDNGRPYDYGDKSGLVGHASEFACGQEAAVISLFSAYKSAIRERVTPKHVRAIDSLFKIAGVRVAPFQAFGKSVQID